MSVPARSTPPLPAPSRSPRPSPARTPATRKPLQEGKPRPRSQPKRRKRHLGFFVLSSVLVGSIVLGLVSLNALLAQTSFRIDDVSNRIDSLSQEYLQLTREQAELSAPGRIAAWASRHGMRLPDDIHFLHVPTSAPAAPAGEPDSLDPRALALKALAEGRP